MAENSTYYGVLQTTSEAGERVDLFPETDGEQVEVEAKGVTVSLNKFLDGLTPTQVGALPAGGTAAAATKLATGRTVQTNLAGTAPATFDGTANITPGVSGVLPAANGGTGNANGTVAKLTTARTVRTNLASTGTASFDGSANITPGVTGTLPVANGGTGNTTGTVAKLTTARAVRTNLSSTGAASFDGSADINPGVAGTLPVSNGGTGATTLPSGQLLVGGGTGAVTGRAIATAIAANPNIPTAAAVKTYVDSSTEGHGIQMGENEATAQPVVLFLRITGKKEG